MKVKGYCAAYSAAYPTKSKKNPSLSIKESDWIFPLLSNTKIVGLTFSIATGILLIIGATTGSIDHSNDMANVVTAIGIFTITGSLVYFIIFLVKQKKAFESAIAIPLKTQGYQLPKEARKYYQLITEIHKKNFLKAEVLLHLGAQGRNVILQLIEEGNLIGIQFLFNKKIEFKSADLRLCVRQSQFAILKFLLSKGIRCTSSEEANELRKFSKILAQNDLKRFNDYKKDANPSQKELERLRSLSNRSIAVEAYLHSHILY